MSRANRKTGEPPLGIKPQFVWLLGFEKEKKIPTRDDIEKRLHDLLNTIRRYSRWNRQYFCHWKIEREILRATLRGATFKTLSLRCRRCSAYVEAKRKNGIS